MTTKKITTLGLLGALSVLLVSLVHFPIFPAAPFLEYDPADIPIFVGGFLFGPIAGLILTIVVSIVQGITVSSASGVIGIIMHILSTGAFVLVSANIYKFNKTKKGAGVALVYGTVTMVLIMTLWNVLITPIFMKVPREVVINMLIPTIIPFNLIKAGANALLTSFVYKRISSLVQKLNIK